MTEKKELTWSKWNINGSWKLVKKGTIREKKTKDELNLLSGLWGKKKHWDFLSRGHSSNWLEK